MQEPPDMDDSQEWMAGTLGTMQVVDSARELQMRSLLADGSDAEAAACASSQLQRFQHITQDDPVSGSIFPA